MSNGKEGTTLRDLVRRLHEIGPVDDDFAADLASIRRQVPTLPAEPPSDAQLAGLLPRYLDEEVTLGKVASELGLSRFELVDLFETLGIPLNIGPVDVEDARREVETARRHGSRPGPANDQTPDS